MPTATYRLGLGLLLGTVLGAGSACADDWPQFLGPRRDSTSTEKGLARTWPQGGPKRIWQREVGEGYSGPVIAGDKLILFHRVGNNEVVECLQAATGKALWKHTAPTQYEDALNKGNGPRATPTIAEGKVITLGAAGELTCLELATGKKLWSRALLEEYRVPPSYFGVGTSPAVERGLVLVNVGGKGAGIVAFQLADGKEAWKATTDGASYSSPVVTTVGGTRQALFFTRDGVVVLDPQTGKVLHRQRFRARIDASVNAATPLVIGDLAFFSASYDTGALLLKLRRDGADEVWQTEDLLSNHYDTSVHHAGQLYGIHGRQERRPSLRCVDLKTRKVRWDRDRFGCATMVLADGLLVVLNEAGDLLLVEVTPQAYRELVRARVFESGPVRAQIALANGRLFARDGRTLACFDLRK